MINAGIMKQLLLLAGAVALASAGPAAFAKDRAKGHGKPGHGQVPALGRRLGPRPLGLWHGGCPPGLAKKNSRCMPPGQYKKLYGAGQPSAMAIAGAMTRFRTTSGRYGFDPPSSYYYGDGYFYRVDPRTMVISGSSTRSCAKISGA